MVIFKVMFKWLRPNNIKYACETWPHVMKLDPSDLAILILSINIKFNWF